MINPLAAAARAWHQARTIDLASGSVGPATDGTGVRRVDAHPDCHQPIAGLRMPHWREITEVGRVGAGQILAPRRRDPARRAFEALDGDRPFQGGTSPM